METALPGKVSATRKEGALASPPQHCVLARASMARLPSRFRLLVVIYPPMSLSCPICSSPMTRVRREWLFLCPACGHWASTMTPAMVEQADKDALDQQTMTAGLRTLRLRNYAQILARLAELMPLAGKRLLDVGCSSGLFLEAAAAQGLNAVGLEPDPTIVRRCRDAGKSVREGLFPDAIDPAERFDIITFNDVLEHIPGPRTIVRACHGLLAEGGLLMINSPNADGILHSIAKTMDRLGGHKPLNRLWQTGFRSPHLHYFNPVRLAKLCQEEGFAEAARMHLDTIVVRGLWQRLTSDQSASKLFSAAVWTTIVVSAPAFKVLPHDITAQIFRKSPAGAAPGT